MGTVALGDVTIVVSPKISGAPLTSLLRYAYGLGSLATFAPADPAVGAGGFQDLLAHQLRVETNALFNRGLHRDYVRVAQALAVPQGRIDFQRYPRTLATADVGVPCVHHPRLEDNILNRTLLAGLRRATTLACDPDLRSSLRQTAAVLEPTVARTTLSLDRVERLRETMDRRHANYHPAVTLIELLLRGEGADLEEQPTRTRLPGFLFDMNKFFQALVSRFLRDHLDGYAIRDEHRLQGLFAYEAGFNPRNRRSPTPRPDFAVMRDEKVVAVLDAKYRDLWEQPLPRDMLYQLALYALSRPSPRSEAAILYPTITDGATEQRIAFRDPVRGQPTARIALRPANLLQLASVLSVKGGHRRRVCSDLAERLAFGI